jgi:hypothetical protein
MSKEVCTEYYKRTRLIFILNRVLGSPLEALYYIMAFIFAKDLNATPLQIALLISIKPFVALLSFYGNLIIKGRPNRLKVFLSLSSLFASLPCFFFPFVNNVWFYLAAYGIFWISARAMVPAWSEIFKINEPKEKRGNIFSKGASANYVIMIFFPLLCSPWIDAYPHIWKWFFFFFAAIQTLNALLLLCIKIRTFSESSEQFVSYNLISLKSIVLDPWKNCWALIKERADFRQYQIVFMFGGAGLILMQPVLPIFFKETLQLSYTQLSLATSLCKGLAFACAAPFWAKQLNRISINLFNCCVNLCAALFVVFILVATFDTSWIYVAYLVYGTMQAGSELSWNLSGPIFSKDKDSTLYTGVNVAMVGIRGCFAPFLGEALFLLTNASTVFIGSGCLCLAGACYSLLSYGKQEKTVVETS